MKPAEQGVQRRMVLVVNCFRNVEIMLFMPPTLKKGGGGILLSACASVRSFVRPFKKNKARVFKFHIWIPHQK